MTGKVLRKIVNIDEEKCNGCGLCVPNCVEGALQIIDGKAKLVSETYCDGLGACLGHCPEGAITVEERWAEGFDEEATQQHMEDSKQKEEPLPCGCPSATVACFEEGEMGNVPETRQSSQPSTLGHWPVQLRLVPPNAPFLRGADLLLTADCVPFAYPEFHRDFLGGKAVLVACPKLDDAQAHLKRLSDIFGQSDIKSVTVLHMEVPCCSGLVYLVKQALTASGKSIPLKEVTIGVKGDILEAREEAGVAG